MGVVEYGTNLGGRDGAWLGSAAWGQTREHKLVALGRSLWLYESTASKPGASRIGDGERDGVLEMKERRTADGGCRASFAARALPV